MRALARRMKNSRVSATRNVMNRNIMSGHVGTKSGRESKRDGSQRVGTVPPKSGRLATMILVDGEMHGRLKLGKDGSESKEKNI